MTTYDSFYKGRPVKVRSIGADKATCQLTLPVWLVREGGFKIGDKLVPKLVDGNIVYERMPSV